jgi:hypothetical protein
MGGHGAKKRDSTKLELALFSYQNLQEMKSLRSKNQVYETFRNLIFFKSKLWEALIAK